MVGYMKQHLGYLQYQLTAWDNPVIQKATIGVSCGMVILLIVVVATLICVKRQQRREEAVEGQRNYYSVYSIIIITHSLTHPVTYSFVHSLCHVHTQNHSFIHSFIQ